MQSAETREARVWKDKAKFQLPSSDKIGVIQDGNQMIVGGAVGQVGPYGINDGIKLGGKDVMSDGGAATESR